MRLNADGVQAAADREDEFHPVRVLKNGRESPISAWQRRAKTIQALTDEVNSLRNDLESLRGSILNRPF